MPGCVVSVRPKGQAIHFFITLQRLVLTNDERVADNTATATFTSGSCSKGVPTVAAWHVNELERNGLKAGIELRHVGVRTALQCGP